MSQSQTRECSICLENDGDAWKVMECGHTFHTSCIEAWADVKSVCPECRRPLPFGRVPSTSTEGEALDQQVAIFGASTAQRSHHICRIHVMRSMSLVNCIILYPLVYASSSMYDDTTINERAALMYRMAFLWSLAVVMAAGHVPAFVLSMPGAALAGYLAGLFVLENWMAAPCAGIFPPVYLIIVETMHAR